MTEPVSFQVLGEANHRSFGESVFFPDFDLGAAVGEVAWWTDGNNIDEGKFLQDKVFRLQIDFWFMPSTASDFHRLMVACCQPAVQNSLDAIPEGMHS